MPWQMVTFHNIQAPPVPQQFRKGTTMRYWFMALAVATLIQAGVQTCAPNEAPEAVEPAANLK